MLLGQLISQGAQCLVDAGLVVLAAAFGVALGDGVREFGRLGGIGGVNLDVDQAGVPAGGGFEFPAQLGTGFLAGAGVPAVHQVEVVHHAVQRLLAGDDFELRLDEIVVGQFRRLAGLEKAQILVILHDLHRGAAQIFLGKDVSDGHRRDENQDEGQQDNGEAIADNLEIVQRMQPSFRGMKGHRQTISKFF